MNERRRSGTRPDREDEHQPANARAAGSAMGSALPSTRPGGLPPPLGEAGAPGHRDPEVRDAQEQAQREQAEVQAGHAGSMQAIEILSHELRSPITTIHLGTKVLRESGNRISRPVRAEVVEAVDEEAERLYRLVEDLLAVARHDGGAAPLPVGPLLLQHWLPPVIEAEVHASPVLVVRASIPSDLPPVLVDDGALAQVLRNLLANAVRYAPEGMPLEIVAWPEEAGTVRLEVLDRGPGIDPSEAARLFEPFYRSAAARAMGSAAGLGLAAAQRLLQAMGADIEALPRQGGGARFVMHLPVAVPEDWPFDEDLEHGLRGADHS